MRINNNIMALNTHRQYTIANGGLAGSSEKLSSGYKINRAGDDAAGLAISEKMRAQIRGLDMASKNSQDAISLVQTAEGALQETHNILQRMRELAVQSGSDTNNDTVDREALDAEFQQLKAEVDDTAAKTKFNNMGVIDGTFDKTNGTAGNITGFTVSGAGTDTLGSLALALNSDYTGIGSGTTTASVSTAGDGNVNITLGSVTFSATDVKDDDASITLTSADGRTVTLSGLTGAGSDGDTATEAELRTMLFDNGATSGSFDVAVTTDSVAGKDFVVQTGANQGDTLTINIDRMDAEVLGISDLNILTGDSSRNQAIQGVDDAINQVSTQRAKLGALQNRLNHKINNLDTSSENLTAAESRIRDIDMAKEMSNYTKQNILIQASTAMLAQANSAPQNVLSLLR